MRKVQLGRDGPQVGVIAASLSAPPTASLPLARLAVLAPATQDPVASGEDKSAAAVLTALAAGSGLVDTDWITAGGHGQEILGRLLPRLNREALVIGGKGGPRLGFRGELKIDNSRGNLINQCQDSLFRFKTGFIDLFQVHWPDATDPAQTARGLLDLRHQGLARHFGVCNYSAAQAAALHAHAPLATAQAPVSLLRRAALIDLAPFCRRAGVTLLAADPLCAGLLARRFAGDETFSDADADAWFVQPAFGRACALARELHQWAQARGLAGETVAASWCLHQPGVGCVLAAATDAAEMSALLAAADVKLSAAELVDLAAMAQRHGFQG